MRSGFIKSLSSTNLDNRSKTISENILEYKELHTNLSAFSSIYYPEGKILEKDSFTMNIDSCCAFVIFNEGKQYIFGHFNSENFIDSKHNSKDLFEDTIPELLLEFKKINKDPSPLKAILVGGNEAFFKKIKNFLHNECKIRIAGTYLDKYDAPHYIDSSLYSKTLVFFSTNKTGVIFSPLLRKGLEVLNGKEISPYKNYDNIIRLRINTLLHYDTLIGIDTTFFPSKNDFKIDKKAILERTHSTSLLEKQTISSLEKPNLDSDTDLSESEDENYSNSLRIFQTKQSI